MSPLGLRPRRPLHYSLPMLDLSQNLHGVILVCIKQDWLLLVTENVSLIQVSRPLF